MSGTVGVKPRHSGKCWFAPLYFLLRDIVGGGGGGGLFGGMFMIEDGPPGEGFDNGGSGGAQPFWGPITTDKFWGFSDEDFKKWYHRCYKQGRGNANKEEMEEAYFAWLEAGGSAEEEEKPSENTERRRRINARTLTSYLETFQTVHL